MERQEGRAASTPTLNMIDQDLDEEEEGGGVIHIMATHSDYAVVQIARRAASAPPLRGLPARTGMVCQVNLEPDQPALYLVRPARFRYR